jgi:pSer/pThr/pTyr-binding forkhead associated (FHA) protein
MRIFLEACGLSTPLTLECDDPGMPPDASIHHDHTLPFLIVGRDPGSDFHLNDSLISRRHAYLQVIAGGLFCFDLGSRSRIQWDGADGPATQGWLEQEHFLWLGGYRLRWRGRVAECAQNAQRVDPLAPEPIDRAGPVPLPEAALELPIRMGASLSRWTIGSRLSLIGRSDECQLVLTDNSISTYHASLVRTPLGIWVVDFLSREGVWVNGVRVRWAWLDDGDTLRIGRFTFIFRYESLPDRVSRIDVPLDAGAFLTAFPVATTNQSAALPAELTKLLELPLNQAARTRAQIALYSPTAAPLDVAPRRRDELNRIADFGGGPPAGWDQHFQFLEMVHSEMMLMVRMFMTMHREQLGSIRDELGRVQQLTRELEILQAKLSEPLGADNSNVESRADRRRLEVESLPSANSRNDPPTRESSFAGRPETRQQRNSPPETAKSASELAASVRTVDAKRASEGVSSPVDSVMAHTQITKRIAELQRERQGYWRKILTAMSTSED